MELTTIDLPDGSRYEGEVNSAGRPHGRGTMTWEDGARGARIVGEFRDGKPHGHGVEIWGDRRSYVGEFCDGNWYRRGVYTLPEGDRYEFIFCRFPRGGLVQGSGAYTSSPDGRRYVGTFSDGEPTEEGVMTKPDGTCFVGKFRDREPAEGVMTKPDGTCFVGKFRNGEPAEGVMTWPDGKCFVGKFRDWELVVPVDEAGRD